MSKRTELEEKTKQIEGSNNFDSDYLEAISIKQFPILLMLGYWTKVQLVE
jgi:hypothetical protein